MKKGFTLIELLAVIVILAIIAVIAVPIVLNIIDETKSNATLRSADFYLDAVEYTISDAYLNHGGLTDGEYPITPEGNLCKTALPCSDENTLKVEVNGEVPTSGTITITNGSISEIELKYDEKTIIKNDESELVYHEGPTQVYKPQYYYFDLDFSGKIGTTAIPSNPSKVPPTGERRYIGYDVENGVVTAAYACFVRNETEYCLKGSDTEAITKNIEIIKVAFADVLNDKTSYGNEICGFDETSANCYIHDGDYLQAYASENSVYTFANSATCQIVTSTGSINCFYGV